jgi:hypothetical protein
MGKDIPVNAPFFKITGDRNKYLSSRAYKLVKDEATVRKEKPKVFKKYPLTSSSEYGWEWPGGKLEMYS